MIVPGMGGAVVRALVLSASLGLVTAGGAGADPCRRAVRLIRRQEPDKAVVLRKIEGFVRAGAVRYTRHAVMRARRREVALEDVGRILREGVHEPSMDIFDADAVQWKVFFRERRPFGEKAVVVMLDEDAAVVLTVVRRAVISPRASRHPYRPDRFVPKGFEDNRGDWRVRESLGDAGDAGDAGDGDEEGDVVPVPVHGKNRFLRRLRGDR